VTSERYVRTELGRDLAAELDATVVPVIELTATIENTATGARARSVTVYAVDDRFSALFTGARFGFGDGELRRPRTVRLNEAARRAIGVGNGDRVQLSLGRPSDLHRETLFGREDAAASVEVVRLSVGDAPRVGEGDRFSLGARQTLPLVGYLSLPAIQRVLGVGDRVNRLLIVHGKDDSADGVSDALSRAMELADHGLRLVPREGGLALESDAFLIDEAGVGAARLVGRSRGLSVLGILTYLANELTVGPDTIPYSTISAIGLLEDAGERGALIRLKMPIEDEIVLNTWAADRLNASTGDPLRLSYFHVGPKEKLEERVVALGVGGVVEMEGLAADPTLTPDFPGLHDADDMASWDAPFPVDLNRIGPADEAYWDAYAATPKAFVSLTNGLEMWKSRYGLLSGVRFLGTGVGDRPSIEEELMAALPSGVTGLRVTSPLEDGLAASSGATDFSGLFIGFSLFLIVSAILLVSLLLGLSLEGRRCEAGLLLATGFGPNSVLRRWMGETSIVTLGGCLVGLPGAVLYCSVMMDSLSTAWVAAVGTRLLTPHFTATSLVVGFAISVGMIVATVYLSVRRFVRTPARVLLVGGEEQGGDMAPGRWRTVAFSGAGVAIVCLGASFAVAASIRVALFFGVGAGLLLSGLALFAGWLSTAHTPWTSSSAGLGVANASRNRGRSLHSVTLVACASFVVVAVGANRHDALSPDHPGVGGFELVAESDVSVRGDLNDRSTQMDLGFSPAEIEDFSEARAYAFRVKPGEDVSCLNLYQPRFPRILGVGKDMTERGGFAFQAVEGASVQNPWSVLYRRFSDNAIPAIADYASATWILHLGLGDDIVVLDDHDQPVRLRIVGLLKDSLLQGELLIAEDRFVEAFPSREGYQFFMIDSPEATAEGNALTLERRLSTFGFDAMPAIQRLAAYKAVENTYMSTFQVLGGLGLCLGTVGLAIVMLKNAVDRRSELALLRAVGYRVSQLNRMVLAEGVFLLLAGLGIGGIAGGVAVAPHLIETATHLPAVSLGTTLGLIFSVGLVACWATTRIALRGDLLPVLKAEV
jgi:ABC-type lipoprotein release transport system permease subunit